MATAIRRHCAVEAAAVAGPATHAAAQAVLVPAETVREFLKTHGVNADGGSSDARAATLRVICVRKSSVGPSRRGRMPLRLEHSSYDPLDCGGRRTVDHSKLKRTPARASPPPIPIAVPSARQQAAPDNVPSS